MYLSSAFKTTHGNFKNQAFVETAQNLQPFAEQKTKVSHFWKSYLRTMKQTSSILFQILQENFSFMYC